MLPRDPRRPMRSAAFLACLGLAVVWPAGPARALGTLFVDGRDGVSPESVQLAFAPGRDGSGTVVVSVRTGVQGTGFHWVLPVPADASEFAKPETGFFDELAKATGVRFTFGAGPSSSGALCAPPSEATSPPPVPPEVIDVPQFFGRAHVTELRLYAPGQVDALLGSLVETTLEPSEATRALLRRWDSAGLALLHLTLQADSPAVQLDGVQFRVGAHAPRFDPSLVDAREGRFLGVTVTVADARQVHPDAAGLGTIDRDRLAFDHSDMLTGSNWAELLAAASDGGRAWVIESAGASNVLLPVASGFRAREFLKSSPYVTRLSTVRAAESGAAATGFVAVPAGEEVDDVSPEYTIFEGAVRGLVPIALPLALASFLRRARRRTPPA